GRAARGGIADVADAHVAYQALHVALMEDIANQTIVLTQKQLVAVTGHDAGGILPAVLQYGECVVQRLVDVRLTDNADNATRVGTSRLLQADAIRTPGANLTADRSRKVRVTRGCRAHRSATGYRTRRSGPSASRQSTEDAAAMPTRATRDPDGPGPDS